MIVLEANYVQKARNFQYVMNVDCTISYLSTFQQNVNAQYSVPQLPVENSFGLRITHCKKNAYCSRQRTYSVITAYLLSVSFQTIQFEQSIYVVKQIELHKHLGTNKLNYTNTQEQCKEEKLNYHTNSKEQCIDQTKLNSNAAMEFSC